MLKYSTVNVLFRLIPSDSLGQSALQQIENTLKMSPAMRGSALALRMQLVVGAA
jgi:hypothetical protein